MKAGDVMMGSEIFMSTVLVAGFLSFFAPCTFPLLPVYIGIMTDGGTGSVIRLGRFRVNLGAIGRTLIFVGGLSTTFIILGFGAGALGSLINNQLVTQVGGFLVVLLGIHQLDLVHIPFLERYKVLNLKRSRTHDFLGTYLLGLTFSFGWTPCVGPVLGAVLVVSAGGGQAFYGAWLMLIYTLGLAIPFLVMAMLSGVLLDKFTQLEAHLGTIKRLGGILIILMGVLLMTDNLNRITAFIEKMI